MNWFNKTHPVCRDCLYFMGECSGEKEFSFFGFHDDPIRCYMPKKTYTSKDYEREREELYNKYYSNLKIHPEAFLVNGNGWYRVLTEQEKD